MKSYLTLTVLVFCCLAWKVNTQTFLCKKDRDCNEDAGMRCQKLDKCKWGECVCKEGHIWGSYGACSQPRNVGQTCNNKTMYCTGSNTQCTTGGMCTCDAGKVPHSSNKYCQNSGTTAPTLCKKHGEDCSTGYCCRGAQCKNNKCECGDNAVWWEAARQCIHEKAVLTMEQDGRCSASYVAGGMDYSNAHVFCEKGLVCRSCPEDSSSSAFKSGRQFCAKPAMSNAPVSTLPVFVLLLPLIACLWT